MKRLITLFFVGQLLIINCPISAATDFVPGKLILKVKPAYRDQCQTQEIDIPRTKKIFSVLQVSSLVKLFPTLKSTGAIDLSLVYEINYSGNASVDEAAQSLMKTGVFEYVEPRYVSQPLYTPNDPNAASQLHHNIIKTYQAWDIEEGDSNVVIGFTDVSFDILLPDLTSNLKRNYNDPIDGVDNDGDGYIDNFNGWDLADGDNDLFKSNSYHGTAAAAFACATVNNNIGVAGTGNKTLFLPVKIAPNSNQNIITMGYEGIVYAVTHGCKIVNCSWGNKFYSQFAQDVVDFATFNYDATIIASSGDSANGVGYYYPASYNHVLSVGGTDNTDANFYTRNHAVDIVAPSLSLFGTGSVSAGNPLYGTTGMNGTSFSAPLVSGAVALVRAHFPSYNALQAAEQVKVNADNIYGLSANAGLTDFLGCGRLNLEQALLGNKPSVMMTGYSVDASNESIAISGQSSNLVCSFINYLFNASNVVATLSCSSAFITITQNIAYLGSLNTLQTADNSLSPYSFDVAANTPINQKVEFKLSFVGDGGYTAYQYFTVEVNRDYINVDINNLATTITSRGKIGYNTPYQQSGLGIQYHPENDSSAIFVSSFMIGTADSTVSDMIYSSLLPAPDFDFSTVNRIVKLNSSSSDFTTEATFNDNGSTSDNIGVEIRQRSYAWNAAPDNNFIIMEYRIKNSGLSQLDQLYTGIFADWEINGTNNIAEFDYTRNLAYSYNPNNPGAYFGIKLLSSGTANCYNFDVVAGGNSGIDISDGFSGFEKYTSLSTPRLSAGGTVGNDVSQVLSVGPFSIPVSDTILVTYALIGGSDLQSLQDNAEAAQSKFNGMQVGINPQFTKNNFELYPNPAKNKCIIVLHSKVNNFSIYDVTGKCLPIDVKELNFNHFELDLKTLNNGIYLIKTELEAKKLIVNK